MLMHTIVACTAKTMAEKTYEDTVSLHNPLSDWFPCARRKG